MLVARDVMGLNTPVFNRVVKDEKSNIICIKTITTLKRWVFYRKKG